MKDNINPNHYRNGKIECIEALESATVNKKGIEAICVANTIKYLWRYEDKNGVEDVKKAKWYLERLIESLESNSKDSKEGFKPIPAKDVTDALFKDIMGYDYKKYPESDS